MGKSKQNKVITFNPISLADKQNRLFNLVFFSALFGLLGNLTYLVFFTIDQITPLIISTLLGTLFYTSVIIFFIVKKQAIQFMLNFAGIALILQQMYSVSILGQEPNFQVMILLASVIFMIGSNAPFILKNLLVASPIVIFFLIENNVIPFHPTPDLISQSRSDLFNMINLLITVIVFFVVFVMYYYRLEKAIVQLKETNKEAMKLAEAKSEFLANMSHEIRTPMNAIIGLNQLILKEHNSEIVDNYSKVIRDTSKHLLDIIDQVLDLEKIESRKIKLNIEPFSFTKLVEDIRNYAQSRSKLSHIEFESIVDDRIEEDMIGDSFKVRQILYNLIDNAFKFTKTGKVTLSIEKKNQLDKILDLLFVIKDTGIGIPLENQKLVFEKFTQISHGKNKNEQGTGLGLAISKGLVTILGGSINLKSQVGVGTEVSVLLTFSCESVVTKVNHPKASLKVETLTDHNHSFRVLVVDDNKINALVAAKMLETLKVNYEVSYDAKSCFDELTKNKYDLILMDHMMPVMDGAEATQFIRKHYNDYKETPIIAFTANVIASEISKFKEYGFTDILTKPVTLKTMDELILKYKPKK